MLVIVRENEHGKITAYFNTGGKSRRLECGGSVLVSINYKNNRLLNNGALVVKV